MPLLAIASLVSACASKNYMGIPLSGGEAPSELQLLAEQARQGDKLAKLNLAERFAQGRGISRNLSAARKLCKQAARDGRAVLWTYSPPVRPGESGRAVPVDGGLQQRGVGDAALCSERFK